MAVTAEQIAEIRSHVGTDLTDPTDEDIGARWERLLSVGLVAQEILRQRRADLLDEPIKLAIDGDYSEDRTENLRSLNDQLAAISDELNTDVEATPALTMGELLRPDWHR